MKLIFIHGSGGCKESFQYQTQYFTGSEAIDLPGHPVGEPCSTIDDYVEWLHAYVEEKGYSDLVVAGHSLGGGIALLYGLTYPDNVRGLISVGSGGRLRVHPNFLDGLERAIADPENVQAPDLGASDLIDPALAATMARRSEENGLPAMLSDLRACDKFDIMDRLGEISMPLLAVCGTEDVMTPPKYSQYMTDSMENARTVLIPGGTHFAYAEKPDEVNRAIEEFLKEL
jgi:pimeloyl-ACP methyl ester carboxylesterase